MADPHRANTSTSNRRLPQGGSSTAPPRRGREDHGLTAEERALLRDLAIVWTNFLALGETHPGMVADFCAAIHRCQSLIAVRVARRADPEIWRLT